MTQKKRRSETTEKKMAKARREGELKAEVERESKVFKLKKDTLVWVKQLIERVADKIDPFETIAILGVTGIVRYVIEENEILLARAMKMFNAPRMASVTTKGGLRFVTPIIWSFIPAETIKKEDLEGLDTLTFELFEWLLAFGIAYVIVRHGGTLLGLLGEGFGNLSGIVGLMMGA